VRRRRCGDDGCGEEVIPVKTVVKWDPFRELDLMERSMRRFGMPLMPVAALPAADIYETDDEYVIELDVPGYAEKELTIEVSNHMLTITGKHEAVSDEKEKTYRLAERLHMEFERRFELPSEVDTEKMKATFKEGVLELHTPKMVAVVPKRIPVNA
jgi:HSP20 family protein